MDNIKMSQSSGHGRGNVSLDVIKDIKDIPGGGSVEW